MKPPAPPGWVYSHAAPNGDPSYRRRLDKMTLLRAVVGKRPIVPGMPLVFSVSKLSGKLVCLPSDEDVVLARAEWGLQGWIEIGRSSSAVYFSEKVLSSEHQSVFDQVLALLREAAQSRHTD